MQLVLEVNNQLSHMFMPDIRMIKKRIEDLIGRDFLERDSVRHPSPILFHMYVCIYSGFNGLVGFNILI